MSTKICIPIVEKNIEVLIEKIFLASQKTPDIIEIWLGEIFSNPGDFEKNGSDFLEKIFTAKKEIGNISFLFTVKNNREKGNFCGSDEEKINILITAVKKRAEYIDIDYEFDSELLEKLKTEITNQKKCTLILSAHFFQGTPTFPSLKNRVQKMLNSGADIVKIAAMPESKKDIISILRLAENLDRKNIPFIAMSMGPMGKFSRIICPLLGSYLAFGSLDVKNSSAPGQMNIDELRENIKNFEF